MPDRRMSCPVLFTSWKFQPVLLLVGDSVENEYYKADRKQVHGLRIYVVPKRERPIHKVSQLREPQYWLLKYRPLRHGLLHAQATLQEPDDSRRCYHRLCCVWSTNGKGSPFGKEPGYRDRACCERHGASPVRSPTFKEFYRSKRGNSATTNNLGSTTPHGTK